MQNIVEALCAEHDCNTNSQGLERIRAAARLRLPYYEANREEASVNFGRSMKDILIPLLMTLSVSLALAWALQGRAEDRPAIEKQRAEAVFKQQSESRRGPTHHVAPASS